MDLQEHEKEFLTRFYEILNAHHGGINIQDHAAYIFSLFFLRYEYCKFKNRYNELIEEGWDTEDPDEYLIENICYIPPEARCPEFFKKILYNNKNYVWFEISQIWRRMELDNPTIRGLIPSNKLEHGHYEYTNILDLIYLISDENNENEIFWANIITSVYNTFSGSDETFKEEFQGLIAYIKLIDVMNGYLLSSNFKNLCEALDFLEEDITEIKQEVYNLEDNSNIEESITLIIYNHLQKYKKNPSKQGFRRKFSKSNYFYELYIRDRHKAEDIKNKIDMGLKSGKINNEYLLEKQCKQELDLISNPQHNNALISIYIHEIDFLLKHFDISDSEKHALLKDACLTRFYANPLFFDEVKKIVEETVELIKTKPLIKINEFDNDDFWISYIIIEDKTIARFLDDFFEKKEEIYADDLSDHIFTFPSYMNTEMVFFVLSCGDVEFGFKERTDFSDIFIIKKELIENSDALKIDQTSDFAKHFESYIDKDFRSHDLKLEKYKTKECTDLGFKIDSFKNPNNGKTWHILDVLNKNEEENKEYNHEDLYEIVSQTPLSEEFLDILSSLDLDIDYAYEIQKQAKNEEDILFMLNKKILEDKNYNQDIISKEDLLSQLDVYKIKFILKSQEDKWSNIKEEFTSKIIFGEIESSYDLHFALEEVLQSNYKLNILNAEIDVLIKFRELDISYGEKLAYYLRDKDIFNNGLAEYLNDLTKPPVIKPKDYCDEGKFAAPRWLVYPELSAYTIGWRMGYGEYYRMRLPYQSEEFDKLFPKPKNWLIHPHDLGFKKVPVLGYFWRKDGLPKYSEIKDDYIEVNDFITIDQYDSEFRNDTLRFETIENAILLAKYYLFKKVGDPRRVSYNTLKRGFELTKEELDYWENFKYSVCLNATYYKFIEDKDLKQKLLDTGDKSLVYISDDEWGGDENLFGFALMEVRDELRRLYKNEDKIDWEYTEYLKL